MRAFEPAAGQLAGVHGHDEARYNRDVMLNEPAPEFALPDLNDQVHRLSEARGRLALVNFWSAECPHSERTDRDIVTALSEWGDEVLLFCIAPNANEDVRLLETTARARGLTLVLRDLDQRVADLFEAQATPHLFLIDRSGVLRYRGAPDDMTWGKRVASRSFLREAVEALLQNAIPAVQDTAAYGCAIFRRF